MSKQYYLQDQELENADQDFFQHKDLSANVRRILRETPPPYNIAIIGKWGLGKSSLVNLATEEARNHPDDYGYVRINAWKYEKEALSKVFLRQVMENLSEPQERVTQQEKAKKHFKDIFRFKSTEDEKAVRASSKAFWKRYGKIFWIYLLISLIIYTLYKMGVQAIDSCLEERGVWKFLVIVLTGYLRNFATLIVLPAIIAILNEIRENIKKTQERQVLQVPEMNVEDYEIELQRIIRKKIEEKESKSGYKIIIVLEDLDRLSIEKMVEALDAIKMFINFPNCIFIVPFDDSILKDALIAARVGREGCIHGAFDSTLSESEQFLDKLFQYKIYLAPLLDYDIKKYAEDLCRNNLKDIFVEYCDEERFMRVLNRILIYPEVKTPRQVKKLVNTFVSYLMLAVDRERNGRVYKEFATTDKGINIIARLSVLQADFSDFFELLFENEHAIEEILDAQGNPSKMKALSQGIKRVLGMSDFSDSQNQNDDDHRAKDISLGKFPSSARPLINFLNYTRRFQTDDLLSYLYVAMDDIVKNTGSKAQQEFLKAAVSGNVDDVMYLLQEMPKLSMAAVEFINRKNDIYDVIHMISCLSYLMNIEGLITEEDKKAIANAIAERAEEIVSVPDEISPEQMEYEGLLICNELAENHNEFSKILNLLLEFEPGISGDIAHEIRVYLEHSAELSEETWNLLQLYIQKAINERMIETDQFIDIRQEYNLTSELLLQDSFKFLIETIANDGSLSGKWNQELCTLFDMLKQSNYIETLELLEPLYGKPFMTKNFLGFLKQAPTKNLLPISVTSKLIKAQIQEADMNSDDINVLLTTCRYEVDEDWSEDFDAYLKDQVGVDEMWDILKVYSDDNSFTLIPNTMDEVITDGFSNRNDINTDCIANIIEVGEEAINKDILTKLQSAAAYNSKNGFEYIPKLLDAYAKVEPDSIHSLINTNITNMKANNVSEDAINCYADYFVLTGNENTETSKNLIGAFLDLVDVKLTKGQVVSACISAYWKLCDFISDDRFQKAEPELYKVASQENCANLYRLFNRKQKVFQAKSELSNSHLKEVCFLAIKYTSLKTQAVETLNNFFGWINDIYKFADLICNAGEENIDYSFSYAVLNKFISKKIITENVREDAVRDICKILHELGSDFLNDLLEDRVEIIHRAFQIVVSSPDSFSSEEVTVLTKWIVDISIFEVSIQPVISEMLMVLLNKASTEQQYTIITEILESIPKDAIRRKKPRYIPVFVGVLTKTGSSELRKQLIFIAREWKINRDVIEQTPASISEELERYLEKKKK